ncbi:unnamed protein product [Thelazia callipaeda]|uniref:Protein kinase domain-containing protein n=1 Tax=Thelazia callipaeda TaxID=103827 RepID=A0A158RBW1_THECL|nr:unnamed protein product [Thelazia callipaeda]
MSSTKLRRKGSQGTTSKASREIVDDDPNVEDKCEHMWPTAADMVLLKGKPRKEWQQPEPISVQQIDFYLGRIPQWYIEEKFLKNPGDYLLARGHDNKLCLSIKSNEAGNPAVHLPIEFCQTKQVKGDRNYYYRIERTILQNRSVWGLIRSYQSCHANILKINTRRDVQLLNPVIPCQGCRYLKTEYCFLNMQIKDKSEVNIGELLCKGERSTIYKAVRYMDKSGLAKTKTEKPIILKEMDEYSVDVLDNLFRELHVVSSIRHALGPNKAISVEAVMVSSPPYSIAYGLCKKGSLLQYLEKNNISMKSKVQILSHIAMTLSQYQKIPVIHGNLRAKNVFVDLSDDKIAKPIYYLGGFQYSTLSKSKKVDPTKVANKRWLAPEVFTTKLLTPETDVFAFAFLMYEVLTMQVPHAAISNANVLEYIKKNPDVRPTVPATVPNWLRVLVNNCWSTAPEKRPQFDNVWQQFKKNDA